MNEPTPDEARALAAQLRQAVADSKASAARAESAILRAAAALQKFVDRATEPGLQ